VNCIFRHLDLSFAKDKSKKPQQGSFWQRLKVVLNFDYRLIAISCRIA